MTGSMLDPARSNQPVVIGEALIWNAIDRARRWLDEANGTSQAELTMRLLKIAEEYGEASAAWVGATGQNPRKGITHTSEDVADELGDVAFTALIAAASLGFDPRRVMATVALKIIGRIGV
ncbi:NTP pyrophosphatase (non-canonical NTP hydrolase) [Streptomyces sp. Ag109_O5-1]|uniref:MazG-like family protein n=1 Tax=Streptomyces sp. Ag109_O5-1 TaxID=1938851 RepID=UPI000F9FD28D|nr:MazG-like family protein [Streptomyces sp. Ag109_O5-1]RPE39114.1 NTP pyrophosphatase (non-canonical NTP hydrolase) [Streptomyces sp. Ag109_O5-1]